MTVAQASSLWGSWTSRPANFPEHEHEQEEEE